MVSSIGYKLSQIKPITGFGIRRNYYNQKYKGTGVMRNVAANTVRYIGNALVNKIANSRSSGFKVTGVGENANQLDVKLNAN